MSTVKKCKKLGNRATQREIKEAHRQKMEMKQIRDNHNREYADRSWIFANLSAKHKHWGDSPAEHDKRKLENNS